MHFKKSKIAVGISLVLLIGIATLKFNGITINLTNSFPIGLYKQTENTDLKKCKNQFVLVCPDANNPAVIEIAKKNILPFGLGCESWAYAPLLKKIVGVPGDNIRVNGNGITINNIQLKNSKLKYAVFGMIIKEGYNHQLQGNEYWVMSDYNVNSFDSRYMGPVIASHIKKCIKPIMVINNNK